MKFLRPLLLSAVVIGFVIWLPYFLKEKPILPEGFCSDCNVILISLDTLRSKSLPCYGYDKNTAPNLCKFAKKSFLFKKAYTPTSKTLDSHFSIFTGLYPKSHGMFMPFTTVLDKKINTLTQILQENGYKTLFSGPLNDYNLPLERGLERGFDYIENGDTPKLWFEKMKKNNLFKTKFFAFLHTYDVHDPYLPAKKNISKFYSQGLKVYITKSEICQHGYVTLSGRYPGRFKGLKLKKNDYCSLLREYRNKFASTYKDYIEIYLAQNDIYWDVFKGLDEEEKKEYVHALYATAIYEMDLELKKFFEFLDTYKLLDKTIVVVTADHGEEFFEHGGHSHAEKLYSESIKVPLIIYIPNSKSGVIDKLTSSVDIMPSILSLLGIKITPEVSGINVFSEKNNDFIFAQHVTTKLSSIITSKYQLITDNFKEGKSELYDLINDPDEQDNLITKYSEVARDLEVKLKNYLDKLPVYNSSRIEPFPTWVDEDQRKKLIETGYF